MRIYLDMCCFNRPYDDQSQLRIAMETQSKLEIQNNIKNGNFELVSSYMLDYECGQNPDFTKRNNILAFIEQYSSQYIGIERKEVIEKKADVLMKNGLKFKDACHVASAIYAKCDYFITTDKRLLRHKSDEVKMVTPIEFITEMEDE